MSRLVKFHIARGFEYGHFLVAANGSAYEMSDPLAPNGINMYSGTAEECLSGFGRLISLPKMIEDFPEIVEATISRLCGDVSDLMQQFSDGDRSVPPRAFADRIREWIVSMPKSFRLRQGVIDAIDYLSAVPQRHHRYQYVNI
jgi:hypothetical protein